MKSKQVHSASRTETAPMKTDPAETTITGTAPATIPAPFFTGCVEPGCDIPADFEAGLWVPMWLGFKFVLARRKPLDPGQKVYEDDNGFENDSEKVYSRWVDAKAECDRRNSTPSPSQGTVAVSEAMTDSNPVQTKDKRGSK